MFAQQFWSAWSHPLPIQQSHTTPSTPASTHSSRDATRASASSCCPATRRNAASASCTRYTPASSPSRLLLSWGRGDGILKFSRHLAARRIFYETRIRGEKGCLHVWYVVGALRGSELGRGKVWVIERALERFGNRRLEMVSKVMVK